MVLFQNLNWNLYYQYQHKKEGYHLHYIDSIDDYLVISRADKSMVNPNDLEKIKEEDHTHLVLEYENNLFSYIISPQKLKLGDKIISSDKADIKVGNCMQLKNIPTDTLIHNVEMKPGKGGQLNRSAGTYSQLIGKDSEYAQVKLSSGEIRLVRVECRATIGMVSNCLLYTSDAADE